MASLRSKIRATEFVSLIAPPPSPDQYLNQHGTEPSSLSVQRQVPPMEEIICICSIPVIYAMSFGLGRIVDNVLETRWPTDF